MAADIIKMKGSDGKVQYPVTSSEAVGMRDGSGNLDKKITTLENTKLNINPGKNLLNLDSCIKGFYINREGVITETEYEYAVTSYIETKGNDLVINQNVGNVFAALYDKNLNYIAGTVVELNAFGKVLQYTEGAVYARFTINYRHIEVQGLKYQIEYGSEPTDYEEFQPLALVEDIKKEEEFNKNYIETNFATQNPGKNLFDPNKWVLGEWITPNGIEEVGFGIGRTNFIPITEGQTLTASSKQNIYQCRAGLFDKDFKFIKGSATEQASDGTRSLSITGTADSKYAVFTFRSCNEGDNNMVEIGDVPTNYEPYTPYKETTEVDQRLIYLEEKTQDIVKKEVEYNLFDKSKTTDGKYLTNSEYLGSNSDYGITDYIPVEEEKKYYGWYFGGNQGGAYGWSFYDANKTFISSNKSDNPVTCPKNTKYLRASGLISNKDIAMIVEGESKPNKYSPYRISIPIEDLPEQVTRVEISQPVLSLPKTLYFIKDKKHILYYDNIFLKEHNRKLQVIFTANKLGTSRKDVFAGAPTEEGEGVINISSVIENLDRASNTLNYKIIDVSKIKQKTYNSLCAGDSFTDIGTWVNEILVQMQGYGSTVNQIGTMGRKDYRHEALSGGTMAGFMLSNAGPAVIVDVKGISELPSTGYPGTSYRDGNGVEWKVRGYKLDDSGNGKLKLGIFKSGGSISDIYEESTNFPLSGTLTKEGELAGDSSISYTNADKAYFNPFWNKDTKQLDFIQYINYWQFEEPNLFCLQFTWNDIPVWAETSQIDKCINNVKTIIDKFHSDYPNAKVVFSIEPFGSLLPSDLDIDGKMYSVLTFANAMYATFEDDPLYNTWFKVSPSYSGVDRINGYYSGGEVALCDRFPDVKTKIAGDTVHCNEQGMRQIGDIIVPIIYSLF